MISKVTKGRFALIALISLFVLPVIIAKLILSQGWYQPGATNRGKLVEPYTTLTELGQASPYIKKGWQLAYVLPSQCGNRCQQQLHLIKQSHIALGKYQERVIPIIWASENTQKLNDSIAVMEMNERLSQQVHVGQIVIVDPLGQLVMAYTTLGQDDLVQLNKDMLSDLRKLLKLSRVG
ncbi:cytochrome oxidase biogenesis cluster protein [Vibrio azureus]|uniref:Cytochrome oxidase biogenesis cluster protein n=1 Tax=Vibrio azureus NBRC 104587 TaxID=1219077 RepID=U3CHG8_9VIBR|nr:hypothetical protein [Vibrio azureus]AUI88439.1 cytochrome oxidase biogenesis cluster protein [Vibrio azureus]GAD77693.1 hypothetical protein VAZ01S_086_00070 [Vibrio azureus NBRC 104587]